MTQIREARVEKGWSQSRLVHALRSQAAAEGLNLPAAESMRILLSRWENGHAAPDATYRRLLGAVLRRSPIDLGFGDGAPAGVPPLRMPCVGREPTRELVDHLDRLFRELARGDNSLGGAAVLAAGECEARALPNLAAKASGSVRTDLLRLASRFAEFCGWLRQDLGDMRAASQWSDLGLRLAREGQDREQSAYVLMRKSNLASDLGRGREALDLAQAALDVEADLSPQSRAAIFRQRALGHSLGGDRKECLADLAAASEALTHVKSVDDRASYITAGFIASEAALCLRHLRTPSAGEAILRPRLRSWPEDIPRDRGHALARLAVALVAGGELEEGAEFLSLAAAVARPTASARLRLEVKRVGQSLPAKTGVAKVEEVKAAVAALP
ncbi:MAG: helix-turn-helix domain-containing protein [Dermatophilaceae bacterium]